MRQNQKLSFRFIFIIILIPLFFISGCRKIPGRKTAISETAFYFDTAVTITLYGDENKKYIAQAFELCEYYENLFSKSIPASDVSRINQTSASGIPAAVADDTFRLIQKSIEYSERSNGAFDITTGALSALWDFTGEHPAVPSESMISECLLTVDYRSVLLDVNNNTVMLTKPGTILDLGGIAKGFIADKLKEYLQSRGIRNGIINLGGNILLLQDKPDGSPYSIGLQKPFGTGGETIATLQLTDKSIVSSGIYERYFYENDTLYHHILDTATGYPVTNDLLGVTIISDCSADGDALSTACFTLGTEDGLELVESLPRTEAVFITSDHQLILSSGLKKTGNIIILKE